MKMKQLCRAALPFLLLLLSLPAIAEEDKADERQERQEERIEQGVKSGELTKHEAKRMGKQQKRIGNVEEKMEADGKLTKKEAHHLNRMQNKASASIHRQKHDRKRR